jgi:hypothetical protein
MTRNPGGTDPLCSSFVNMDIRRSSLTRSLSKSPGCWFRSSGGVEGSSPSDDLVMFDLDLVREQSDILAGEAPMSWSC